MKKIANFITTLVLGGLAIVFVVLFYSYFTQFNTLQKKVIGNDCVSYGGNQVRIFSKTINNTADEHELYTTKKTDRTVGNVLDSINKKEQTFKFKSTTLGIGRFVIGVKNHQALYEKGSYWQIISPTLNQKMTFDEFENQFDINKDFSSYVRDWSVNVGIDLFPIVTDTVVIFYETKKAE